MRAIPTRVAVISMHTSPLDQPGDGDAGGLNVYVAETARRLGVAGVAVDVFTRATAPAQPATESLADRVQVHALPAGPFDGLRKEDLPGQVCAFTSALLRHAELRGRGYDAVHSHYWLSGQAGWLAAERWRVPLIHTMHTTAKVKNRMLAEGDRPEPVMRVVGEEQLVGAADRLVANTAAERADLVRLYGADPDRVEIVHPGVDLDRFAPGSRRAAREALGLPADKRILLFVGRLQPLKAPDLLIEAAARMIAADPGLREELLVVICGGLSGNGLDHPDGLLALARRLGVGDVVRFLSPVGREELVDLYRSADAVAVPSHSESFGLVALEAQACGTPVVAAAVGGLPTAVADGISGLLVPGHDPQEWAHTLAAVLSQPRLRQSLGSNAPVHAAQFSWEATAAATLEVYRSAMAGRGIGLLQAAN